MPKGVKGFQKGNKITLGRKHTEEEKRKMSVNNTRGFLGKKHTEEPSKSQSNGKIIKIVV